MKRKNDSQRGDLNGFLDAGSFIKGELHFEDTFRLDGRLEGGVASTGDLVVGENGHVDAEIEVGRIFVSGTVRGSVVARQRIEIAPSGRVYADLETPSLVVEDGALVQGHCNMGAKEPGKVDNARPEPSKPKAVVMPMPVPTEK